MKRGKTIISTSFITVFEWSQAFVRDFELEGIDEWSWIVQNGYVVYIDGAHRFSTEGSISNFVNWKKQEP